MLRTLKIAATFAALTLSACVSATQTPDKSIEPIPLSPATQGELTSYLRKVKATRPGAFAVSPDGRNSFYTWCDDIACMTQNYSMPALRGCQSLSGAPCVVLYYRDEPRVAFTRAAAEGGAPTGRHGSEEQPPIDFDTRGGHN